MKSNKRIEIFKKLFPFIKPEKRLYFYLAVFKAVLLGSSLTVPVFYKMLIQNVIIDKNLGMIVYVILGYAGLFLTDTLFIALNKKTYNTLFLKMKIRIRQKLFKKINGMEYTDAAQFESGDLMKRAESDIDVIENFFNKHVLEYAYAIISIAVISIILLSMSWQLALFGFAMVPISFLFANFMGKKVGVVGARLREEYGSYNTFLHDTLQNWKDVKANNLQENEDSAMQDHWARIAPLRIKSQVLWFVNRGFIAFKDQFITKMNLYFVGGIFIINGNLEVAVLLVFMSYYEKFFANIALITDAVVNLKKDEPSIERVLELTDKKEDIRPKASLQGSSITVENITFSYNGELGDVLKDVSIKVNEKEHVAIVGRSGCGKTTLAKLILGLYSPIEGRICVGGYDISHISHESLNRKINIVMQNPALLNLSFRENLLLARHDASVDEIRYACEIADIHSFIASLPDGYDTIIGEKGIKLSGGQKQRLAIARTFLYNPDIIIFDEATSSLDSESEKNILKSVEKLSEHKTLITIAHRLSSVIAANRVYVMDKGKISASGTHSELKGNNDIYDMMFAGQYNTD